MRQAPSPSVWEANANAACSNHGFKRKNSIVIADRGVSVFAHGLTKRRFNNTTNKPTHILFGLPYSILETLDNTKFSPQDLLDNIMYDFLVKRGRRLYH